MLFCVFARRREQAVVGMLFYLLRAAASRPSLECSFIFCAPLRAGRRSNALLSFARRREKAVVGMLFYLLRAAASRPSLECSFIFSRPRNERRRCFTGTARDMKKPIELTD